VARAEPASLPPMPRDLDGIVALLSEGGHPRLAAVVRTSARPAAVEPGRLRLAWTAGTPPETGRELASALHALTGRRWGVDGAPSDAPTLAERDDAARRARMEEARDWPQVRAVLDKIPGATIVGVETRTGDDAPAPPPRQEGSLSG
jgi:DNA polymerase-3 subunit gamma/tau